MKPKISIIIPIFNEAQTIQPTLNSIIDQTYKDFEVIYVDDASTDTSIKILEKYKKDDSRIKILSTNGEGTSFAQNLALKSARGKYIMFCQNGNLMSANLLEYLMKIIEENKAKIAICDYFNVREFDFFSYSLTPPTQPEETLEVLTSKQYLQNLSSPDNHIFESTCVLFNKLIDKSVLEDFSFDIEKFHSNQFAIFDLFNNPYTIISSNQILIGNAIINEQFKRTCYSYNDPEEVEFMQKVFVYIKNSKNAIALKYTAIRITILLYNIRLKLTNPYIDIYDLEEQRKNIDQKFSSIRKFLKALYPNDEDNEEDYTFYFKRYKKLLHDEKFREKFDFLFLVPPRQFIELDVPEMKKWPYFDI